MGKKTDAVIGRIDRLEDEVYGSGSDALDFGLDPFLVAPVVDGLASGLRCCKRLLMGDYEDLSDAALARAMLDGVLLSVGVKLAIFQADSPEDIRSIADDLVNGLIDSGVLSDNSADNDEEQNASE